MTGPTVKSTFRRNWSAPCSSSCGIVNTSSSSRSIATSERLRGRTSPISRLNSYTKKFAWWRKRTAVKSKTLFALVLFFTASAWAADSRTLRWSRLAVTAHLDADGKLHVQERHSIIFNGDWNGGERIFRSSLENVLDLERISRIDASGRAIPLRYDKSLAHVDD